MIFWTTREEAYRPENRGPAVSPFSDLAVTDGGGELRQPDPMLISPGRQLGDVTPAWWCLMDT